MRTTDPATILQWQIARGAHGGGVRTPSEQFPGIYDAYILDTDVTNPTLLTTAGTCRVVVPAYDGQVALGPCSYPGDTAPPDQTPVVVGFIAPQANSSSGIAVRVLALIGWGGGGSGDGLSPFLLMGA